VLRKLFKIGFTVSLSWNKILMFVQSKLSLECIKWEIDPTYVCFSFSSTHHIQKKCKGNSYFLGDHS